jgi:hypothetical protein
LVHMKMEALQSSWQAGDLQKSRCSSLSPKAMWRQTSPFHGGS